MTWVRLEDSYPEHPKVIALSNQAFRAHITGICYAAKYLTDGFIPDDFARTRGGRKSGTSELVQRGLWDEVPGGYQIHDYLDYNPSKVQVLAKRMANAKAGAKGAEARWAKEEHGEGHGTPQDWQNAPSRPVPSPKPKPKPKTSFVARPEAVSLCDQLADCIAANGDPRPTITKTWLQEADRLLRIDVREFKEARELIAWCQADSFWRSNILSMPTFRKQYTQLRRKREAEGSPQQRFESPVERVAHRAMERIGDNGSGPGGATGGEAVRSVPREGDQRGKRALGSGEPEQLPL